MATLAPPSPRAWAKARPRPRLPPVTTATFPVSVNVSSTVMAVSSGFGTCVCPDGVVRGRYGGASRPLRQERPEHAHRLRPLGVLGRRVVLAPGLEQSAH